MQFLLNELKEFPKKWKKTNCLLSSEIENIEENYKTYHWEKLKIKAAENSSKKTHWVCHDVDTANSVS